MSTENAKAFLKACKMPLFSERETVQEAVDYVAELTKAGNITVMTAAFVLSNTIIREALKHLEDNK